MTTDKLKKLLSVQLALFIASVAIAIYLAWHHYQLVNGAQVNSICSINAVLDCESVNASRYAEFLGIPLAIWGLSYYLVGAIATLLALSSPMWRREVFLFLLPASIASLFVSLILDYVMFSLLQKVCLFCGLLHALSVVLLAVAVFSWKNLDFKFSFFEEFKNASKSKLATFPVLFAVLLGISHALARQIQIERPTNFSENAFKNLFLAQSPVTVEIGEAPVMGRLDLKKPVQIIEFADFQCPACGFASMKMAYYLKKYADQIQVVFKHYPLDPQCNGDVKHSMHPYACLAAKTAHCAQQQGKFAETYHYFFEHQAEISAEKIAEWVDAIGLDKAKLQQCVNDPATRTQIQKDIDQGKMVGVGSTPTFFINGRKIEGAIEEEKLKAILEIFN